MTRWEYLVVDWNLTATPPIGPGYTWTLEGAYQITRPGPLLPETRRYDGSQPSSIAFELLNELGGEGWELVSSEVERSTVAPAQGYQTAGVPIATRQIFKRALD